MNYTVLGADGFIGSYLKNYLAKENHDVVSVGRRSTLNKNENLGHVIFAIGLTSDFRQRPLEAVEAHVCALRDLLESNNFESLLYLSSTRVYSKSHSTIETSPLNVDSTSISDLYNLSKLMGESLCFSGTGKSTKVVRLSNIFGADSTGDFITDLVHQAKNGHVKLTTSMHSEKDYLSLERLGPIIESIILDGQHRLYNVASGFNTSNKQIIDLLQKKYDCDVETVCDAQDWSFKSIDISRIREEFSFSVPPFELEFEKAFPSI